jgi:hypothetical protein
MRKYYIILAVVAIVAASSIASAAFFWRTGQSTQNSAHVYHVGDQIPNTYFTFDGFTYMYPPISHPLPGTTPNPTTSPTQELCVVFKLNAAGEAANQASGTHISYPSQDVITMNPNGNTKTDLGDKLDNQFYTIVAYNLADQTISMVYG